MVTKAFEKRQCWERGRPARLRPRRARSRADAPTRQAPAILSRGFDTLPSTWRPFMSQSFRMLGLVAYVLLPVGLAAQESPFLPEDTYRKLVNEISGDIAYD